MSRPDEGIAVLVSAGRHPVSGLPRACRGDTVAMGLGLEIAGDAVRIVHAGEAGSPALEHYFAFGAPRIEVIAALEGSDVLPALGTHVRNAGLVLTGIMAEHGVGSGLLPYALAARLGWPIVANVLGVEVRGGEAHVLQFLPKGKRRRLAVALPAVLTVHPLAPVRLTYAYARSVEGRVETISVEDRETRIAKPEPASSVETSARQPVRLSAGGRKSAHMRLEAAISAKPKGGVVVREGNPAEKAQAILRYLRENRLIEF